jgi:hypothetical protein
MKFFIGMRLSGLFFVFYENFQLNDSFAIVDAFSPAHFTQSGKGSVIALQSAQHKTISGDNQYAPHISCLSGQVSSA